MKMANVQLLCQRLSLKGGKNDMIKKLYKNEKGVTLIELLIAMAILGIVLSVAYSLLFYGNTTFSHGNRQYNTQSSVRIAADYAEQELRFATTISILNSVPSPKLEPYNYMYIDNGRLVHEIYDSGSGNYSTRSFNLNVLDNISTFAFIDDSRLGITIEAEDGEQGYLLNREVNLLNVSLVSEAITGTTGDVVAFRKDFSNFVPGPAPDPGPDPVVPETTVTVTISVDKNNAKATLYDSYHGFRILEPTGSPARTFIFIDVPANDYIHLEIRDNHGNVKVDETIYIEDTDETIFRSI